MHLAKLKVNTGEVLLFGQDQENNAHLHPLMQHYTGKNNKHQKEKKLGWVLERKKQNFWDGYIIEYSRGNLRDCTFWKTKNLARLTHDEPYSNQPNSTSQQ